MCYVFLWADEEDLTLRADIYSFLLQLHVDITDWKSALQLLDKAIRDMPCTRHRLWVTKYHNVELGKGDEGEKTKINPIVVYVWPDLCWNGVYWWKYDWGKMYWWTCRSYKIKMGGAVHLCGIRWHFVLAIKPNSWPAIRNPSPLPW